MNNKPKPLKEVHITFRISTRLNDKLELLSSKIKVNRSKIIRRALIQYIDEELKKIKEEFNQIKE